MMNYTYDDIIKKISKLWYKKTREWKWSHVLWSHDDHDKNIILPNHGSKTLSKWVIKTAITQTWLSNKEFTKL